MPNFSVRHYASKTIDIAHNSEYSMLAIELFIAILSFSFIAAGYLQDQLLLIFIFSFPAVFSTLAVIITISFMLYVRYGKNKKT